MEVEMMPEVLSHLIEGSKLASRREPAGELATIVFVWIARSRTRREIASTSSKFARIASIMIRWEIDTMCAWRILRRSTIAVSARRNASSPRLGCPA